MRNSGVLLFGTVLILIGVLILAGSFLDVNLWNYFWPAILIVLGVWMLLRPRLSGSLGSASILLLNNMRRRGTWQVKDEEIWVFLGDVFLDLTNADIPNGETVYRIYGFIGDVDLIAPQDVGISISSAGFINEIRVFGKKQSSIVFPVEASSDNYVSAERKIRLDVAFFISDVKVKPAS